MEVNIQSFASEDICGGQAMEIRDVYDFETKDNYLLIWCKGCTRGTKIELGANKK